MTTQEKASNPYSVVYHVNNSHLAPKGTGKDFAGTVVDATGKPGSGLIELNAQNERKQYPTGRVVVEELGSTANIVVQSCWVPQKSLVQLGERSGKGTPPVGLRLVISGIEWLWSGDYDFGPVSGREASREELLEIIKKLTS